MRKLFYFVRIIMLIKKKNVYKNTGLHIYKFLAIIFQGALAMC